MNLLCFKFLILQYINPIVKNSQHPLKGNLLYATERILKLSVPNLYVWLCMFYCFFHLWYVFAAVRTFWMKLLCWALKLRSLISPDRLNILAELLCFGDREFYKDWWNAKTVEEVIYICPVKNYFLRFLHPFRFWKIILTICLDFVDFPLAPWLQYWRMWNMVRCSIHFFKVIFFFSCDLSFRC